MSKQKLTSAYSALPDIIADIKTVKATEGFQNLEVKVVILVLPDDCPKKRKMSKFKRLKLKLLRRV